MVVEGLFYGHNIGENSGGAGGRWDGKGARREVPDPKELYHEKWRKKKRAKNHVLWPFKLCVFKVERESAPWSCQQLTGHALTHPLGRLLLIKYCSMPPCLLPSALRNSYTYNNCSLSSKFTRQHHHHHHHHSIYFPSQWQYCLIGILRVGPLGSTHIPAMSSHSSWEPRG